MPLETTGRFASVAGLMSGTSVDGLDLVLVSFRGETPRLKESWSVRYPARLRDRLLRCAAGESTAWELGQLHHDLGRWYARQAVRCLANTRVQALGVHGQTVYHHASRGSSATLQIGEASYLAAALGVPVVSNFRAMDLALGGQGAPLATLFHLRAWARRGAHVCVQNLGGIGNVTSLDWRSGSAPRILAFDTGPANMLLDAAMMESSGGVKTYDRDGRCAARGQPIWRLVERWLRADAFLRAHPPKSTGRERYGARAFESMSRDLNRESASLPDRLATLTAFTAATVAENYARHLPGCPDTVVLCGGGARNPVLRIAIQAAIDQRVGHAPVVTSDEWGWPSSTVEGAAFALLARERLLRRPGNLPETTGARRAALCGQVTLP
ncbi:MAG: anhydro-N-acetylmuramic acid kinase [Verrucomicrobiales bacterium]|nr:anhydro-N-acetylmuramic acid kinase [Verrucomicrobiales bacterium]